MFGSFPAAPAAAAAPAPAATAPGSGASATASPPAPASFGAAAATTTAPAVPVQAAPLTGLTAAAPQPPAPASAAPTAAAPPATPAPPPPTYERLLDKAYRDGVVSDALAQEIKKRFAAPMEVTTATAATGAAQALAAAQQVGSQWKTTAAPQALLTATSVSSTAPAGAPALGHASDAQHQRRQLAQNAASFLELLMRCDSGYNNSEAPPADNPASSHWVETRGEEMKGLHAAVGAVAGPAASNLISFIKAAVVKHSQALDGDATTATSGLFGDGRRARSHSSPLLLAAQCLYLLSRHFQLTASTVKEALELVESLYLLLKNSLRSRTVALAAFSEGADTCALNSLTWLCVFSVVNMVAVWKKLRTATGELRHNQLIQSGAASTIGGVVTKLRAQLVEAVQSSALGLYGGGGDFAADGRGAGGGAGAARMYGAAPSSSPAAAAMPLAVCTWHVVVDSYLSILTLAEGCLLRAKGSDEGFDRALDAFLGERASTVTSVVAAALSPASLAVHRGKVTKRMVELAPAPRLLSLRLSLLYIAPYEIMSYLFDEMLPLLRHVSELEVATHRRYTEQLEELPRISAAVRAGAGSGGGAFEQRPNRLGATGVGQRIDGDGGDGWLRRLTRVGLHGEVVGEPFTSEMAHLLEALAVCLQHLQPEVLNPDLDSDCAATFFIFKNFVKHMRQVFATQRSGDDSGSSSAVWENYTLKLMTRFLEVLAMIGRNPQYTERVVVLLTDAQTECGELQWPSLVAQALECAGFNSGALGVAVGAGSPSLSAVAAAAAAQSSASLSLSAAASRDGEADEAYALSSGVLAGSGGSRALHRQFTRPYARKCQRHYISSFFLLLRQLFAHPTLRPLVSAYINLELALTFLFAPQQSQVMLGSTLSLISALITSAADAQLVWSFLEQRQLLQQTSVRTQSSGAANEGAAAPYDRFNASAGPGGAVPSRERTWHEETLSLMGHCQHECAHGTYDITVGFLNLVTALFQYGQPSMAALATYTSVTNFIAQEILRGVLKRVFAVPHERYTVFALAAAALRQALRVRFLGENGRTAVLPFSTVMALNKAPADVLGEVVKLILDASDASCELLSHHRAAVRQALQLLIAAIETAQEQEMEVLLFDSRTTLSIDLAVHVLGLCAQGDTLLTKTTLQLMLLFPVDTACQAAGRWSGQKATYAPVLDFFTQLLHPLSVLPIVKPAPPELAQLDFSPAEAVAGWSTALLTETKALLLDLLMRHATVTEPSLTAWMCGFYHEEPTGAKAHSPDDSAHGEPSWWRTTLLTSVVEGACSDAVEHAHPALAVKCVKLLYLLRANRLYGALVVRPFLESVCQTLFLHLQHFCASHCSPVALSKYAYVLKLLALEACYAYGTSPADLKLAQTTSISSISVEVLLSLLYPFRASTEGDRELHAYPSRGAAVSGSTLEGSSFGAGSFDAGPDAVSGPLVSQGSREGSPRGAGVVVSRDAAVDITSWLPQALQVLPRFPENLPPVTGGRNHLVPCAGDGVVQYNVASLYEAFQMEQMRANKPELTMAELQAKLQPFIVANDCFFSYAAGVNFVEGWCQLVCISCSVVQGLSASRLRAFAHCILHGLDATTTMTAAAQEQVSARLCYCLSTVLAHLRRTTLRAVDELTLVQSAAPESQRDAAFTSDYASHGTRADAGLRRASGVSADARGELRNSGRGVELVHGQGNTGVEAPSTAHAVSRRRPRDDGAGSTALSGPFATQAGEASNFYSTANRTQLARSLLQRRQAEGSFAATLSGGGDATYGRPSMAALAEDVDANAALLQPFINAFVKWGTRINSIRAELYQSFLCLAETPGIRLDDVVLWRSQKTLLEVICADIRSGCAAAVSGGAAAAASADASVQPAAGAGGGALSPSVQQAVALLVALLQASAPIRDDLCRAPSGSKEGMSASAKNCATALLESVDVAVCRFFAGSGASLPSLLWQIRSTFDLLSILSLSHGSLVLHSDVLRLSFTMQAWKHGAQVVLGFSQAVFVHEQMASKPVVEQNKEVLRRLLLGVVRWVNLLLSSLGDATRLLELVRQFIAENRTIIDYVFLSPAAVSSTVPGSARLSASHLTLCAEMSECLRALSTSALAFDCRALVDSLALPDLLSLLSSDEVWGRGPTDLYDFADMEAGLSGFQAATGAAAETRGRTASGYGEGDGAGRYGGLSSGGSDDRGGPSAAAPAASLVERGRDAVALTVRNLAHLLLNTEYVQRSVADGTQDATGELMLRFSAGKRMLCVQIVRRVASSLYQNAASPGRAFQLECYLYATHALVCLLHSFVLPLPESAAVRTAASGFPAYLAKLPLADMVEALTQARDAVYHLTTFNTDYRGGLRVPHIGTEPWAATLDAGAREAGDTAAAHASSQSSGQRLPRRDGEGAQPASTPKSTPAMHSADAFSVPSTPGLLPAAESRRGGRDASLPQAPPQPQPRHGAAAGARPLAAPHGSAAQSRDPNSTVVQSMRGYGSGSSMGANGAGADGRHAGNAQRHSLLPATADGATLQPDCTLWELMPERAASGGDDWTRVYTSFQNRGALSLSEADGACAAEETLRWERVLNVENEVRLVKIAIANALHATTAAMETVRKAA